MWIWLWIACSDGKGAPPPPVPVARAASPALPDDVLLQLHVPATGELYRVGTDGRFLVTARSGEPERQQPPLSKAEPGRQTVSEAGLARLRAALGGFLALPANVPAAVCVPAGTVLRNSGRGIVLRPVVFSARLDGEVHTVEVQADLGAQCTLGPLAPVYQALDDEALGGWTNE